MKILRYKDFEKSLIALGKKGGNYKRAYEQVCAVLGKAHNSGDPFESLKRTKHGEQRIEKCIKYDLIGFCRLITTRDSGYVILLFCGAHADCDKWIESNRGLKVKADPNARAVVVLESIDIQSSQTRLSGGLPTFPGRLLDRLPKKIRNKLMAGVPAFFTKALSEMSSITDEEEILEAVCHMQISDQQRTAIYDVLTLLKKGDWQHAENRANAFFGNLLPISDSTVLKESEFLRELPPDPKQHQELLEHYIKTADYKDWMLFMHPDQNQFVDTDYPGAFKISGVSGSGKTCVVVKRAIRLASLYPKEKILILTLNRSLAELIENLVTYVAANDAIRKRIKVLPFFALCQQLLNKFDPKNEKLYVDVTWKGEEHVDGIWAEYYRCELNNHDAQVMQKVHDSLIARGIDAESYIREEFDWIRSVVSTKKRNDYLHLSRTGRAYPLDGAFRSSLLDGLKSWEKKMRDIGVTDYLGISTALYAHIKKIQPMYRAILVDESQDFGTIELEIISRLATPQKNHLFFCGDAAQQVLHKHQDFKAAGIEFSSGKSNKLSRNYRNGRDILRVAHTVLVKNLADQMVDNKEFEVLDPNLSHFPGDSPLLLSADSLSQEIAAAKRHAEEQLQNDQKQKTCLVICGYSLYELQDFGKQQGIPVLDGTKKRARALDNASIFISDLENSKGFEFQRVCILNCSNTVIPYPGSPEKEQFRDLARLYVAMTRAVTQLILSYTGKPSGFLRPAKNDFLEESWLSYLNIQPSELESISEPLKIDVIRRPHDDPQTPIAQMTGEQFLYTKHAIGLDLSLIEKIRSLITGKRATHDGRPVAWENFADAKAAIENHPSARKQFGADLDAFKVLLSEHLN
ncbi:MAG: DNA helicase [Arenicellales bacterium IbO2]|nr:UvrD-helicase domain-containing protein [Gammaproteobacteria bacterium]MDA7962443.1 UvrD-helicase domain-containing protein [Gammaproteobacteria bacterium]MDA8030353.1 UvrD-helicase domain-containing protein [Alphaproteobacteria bacterium]CAJ2377209.1 MAG: DNA helicase [Arenicellales bacterium IbO2]